jgi:hypothetical protein
VLVTIIKVGVASNLEISGSSQIKTNQRVSNYLIRVICLINSGNFTRSDVDSNVFNYCKYVQSVFEMCAEILTTSYWLHVELGKNI